MFQCTVEIYGSSTMNDLNNAPLNSISFAYPSATNHPFNGVNAILFTFGLDDTHKHQLAIGGSQLALRRMDVDTKKWNSWSILG